MENAEKLNKALNIYELSTEVDHLRTVNAKLVEALEKAETTEGEYGQMCPVCYCIQDKHQMHNAGCKLQAALALAKGV